MLIPNYVLGSSYWKNAIHDLVALHITKNTQTKDLICFCRHYRSNQHRGGGGGGGKSSSCTSSNGCRSRSRSCSGGGGGSGGDGSSSSSSWWRHQMENFFVLLAICAGNHQWPVNSSHKGQWCRALIFSLICVWINGWVNNGEAGDLRRDHAHYDVTVMFKASISNRNWDSNGSRNSSLKNYSKMSIIYVFVINRSYFFHLIGNQFINWHITICCSICSCGRQIWSPQTANGGLRGPPRYPYKITCTLQFSWDQHNAFSIPKNMF